ncbi:MAG TPA: hypothetical protein VFG62_02200 [Rhodopila sp.]|jgi:hypothetical protein|nr:hypothetical protein [Rhodopila sp.]
MPSGAKTDDDIDLKPSRRARRDWVAVNLGVDMMAIEALDLAVAQSPREQLPVLVNRLRDIMQPLVDAPRADLDEVSAAMHQARDVQTALRGVITAETIAGIRRQMAGLEQAVAAALRAIATVDERRRELIAEAHGLACTTEAGDATEGALIAIFSEQKAAVEAAFAKPPLSRPQIQEAETALAAARKAIQDIALAVDARLGARRLKLVEAANALRYEADADPEKEKAEIAGFEAERSRVTGLPANDLTGVVLDDAERHLNLATEAIRIIAEAVRVRHEAWAGDIRRRADALVKPFLDDQTIDPSVWAVPRATREEIEKVLVSS